MFKKWLARANSATALDHRKAIQGAMAVVCVGVAALCMWNNAQTPLGMSDSGLLASLEEAVLPPAPESDTESAAVRPRRVLPQPVPMETSTIDQLVIHVDKHGNIDVAGELINPDVFRNLLNSVKEDSSGDVSVLIHANEKCEVSNIQRVVDVCEECFTQYRLRIEGNRSPVKPVKPALSNRA
jgi:hypothetical protein